MPLLVHDPGIRNWFIGENQMVGPGWGPENQEQVAQLWTPAALSPSNPAVAGKHGGEARRPRQIEANYAINLSISGEFDQAGNAHPDIDTGIKLNYLTLAAIIGTPDDWDGPTIGTFVQITSTLWVGGGIQPWLSPIMSVSGGVARCVLNVQVPDGRLQVVTAPVFSTSSSS